MHLSCRNFPSTAGRSESPVDFQLLGDQRAFLIPHHVLITTISLLDGNIFHVVRALNSEHAGLEQNVTFKKQMKRLFLHTGGV